MATANEAILDEFIDRQITLEGLKKSEAREIRKLLEREVIPDIRKRLASRLRRIRSRGYDKGPWTTKALKELRTTTEQILSDATSSLARKQSDRLVEFAKLERDWAAGVIEGQVGQFGVTVGKPSVHSLRALVNTHPFEGQILKDWYADLGKRTASNVLKQVRIGIATGESAAKVAKRIEGPLKATRAQAEAVARTAIQHVSAQTRRQTFEENSDLIKHEVWQATLDSRTSLICIDLDGTVFPVGEGQFPPAHFNCRSWRRPEMKSAKDLGLPIKDFDVTGIDGKPAGATSYKDWLARQSKETQDKILGPGRAALFRKDPSVVGKFTDKDLKPVSLEKLGAKVKPLSKAKPKAKKTEVAKPKPPKKIPTTNLRTKGGTPLPPKPSAQKLRRDEINQRLARIEKLENKKSLTDRDRELLEKHRAKVQELTARATKSKSPKTKSGDFPLPGFSRELREALSENMDLINQIEDKGRRATSAEKALLGNLHDRQEELLAGNLVPAPKLSGSKITKRARTTRSRRGTHRENVVEIENEIESIEVKNEISPVEKRRLSKLHDQLGDELSAALKDDVGSAPSTPRPPKVKRQSKKGNVFSSVDTDRFDPILKDMMTSTGRTSVHFDLSEKYQRDLRQVVNEFASISPRAAVQMKEIRVDEFSKHLGAFSHKVAMGARKGEAINTLRIPRDYWSKSNFKKGEAIARRMARNGEIVGSSFKDTFTHEIGHALKLLETRGTSRAVRKLVDEWHRVADEISLYAKTNADEAFAEAYTIVMRMPRSKWSKLAREFAEELRAGLEDEGLSVPQQLVQ